MDEAQKDGKGAVALDGRLIDYASIRQAEVLVKKAEQIAGAHARRHGGRAGGGAESIAGMPTFLDFEKPIAELEGKIDELRHLSNAGDINIAEEMARLQAKADKLLRQTYGKLSAWQKTQVARHPERPHFSDYVAALIEDYTPLAGDRSFADDTRDPGRPRPLPRQSRSSSSAMRRAPTPDPRAAQFRHGQAGRLSQGAAPDGSWPTVSSCRW